MYICKIVKKTLIDVISLRVILVRIFIVHSKTSRMKNENITLSVYVGKTYQCINWNVFTLFYLN